MKIFVIGASGMIGSRVVAEAVARGHTVIAGARNPGKIAVVPGVEPVRVDTAELASMVGPAVGADVIVATVSPRSTGDAVAEGIANGKAIIAAAQAAGKRLVMVGGAGTLNLPDGSPLLPHLPEMYLAEATGMKAVSVLLADSGLGWTFFAPAGMIAPGERTGVFRLGGNVLLSDAAGVSAISAEDYAVALVDELETAAHAGQIFTIAY